MARTSGINELLSKYKATQRSTIENMGKEQQELSESDGRMAVQRTAPEPRTMLQQMQDVARDREAAKRLGVDRFRTPKRQCSNPECEDPTARPEVDADGNMLCPACGHVDAGAVPELAGPDSSNLSDLEGGEGRTFKDDLDNGGSDKRRGQEYQDEANVAYYVIDPREVRGATERQRWWANNRMNQAMIWADLLREDHEDPNGFAMPPDEVKEIKNILRRVCVTVAQRAPEDELTKEDVDQVTGADASAIQNLGSPVLWTILLALEMIARRPEGFKVRRPEFQAIATLEGMHAYLGRFQSRATRRYVEKLNFYTRAKGAEARMAQSSLDRVKTRSAAYVGLGSYYMRQAKIATLDNLLKKSGVFGVDVRGQPVGLSLPVLNNETPGVMDALPNEVANPRVNAREPGVYNPGLVNRTKEKEKVVSYHKQKKKEYADRSLIKPDPKAKKPWEFGGGEWAPEKAPKAFKAARAGDSSSDDDDDDPNLPRELRNLPKALRRSILQEEGRQMVQQPAPQPSSDNNQEWVGFGDAAAVNDAGPSSSSDPGGASDAAAPGVTAPPGQPARASTFSITDLPDDDDDDDDDDNVVVQDMDFGLGDGSSSVPGGAVQSADGMVTDEDGVVTALPGMGGDGDDDGDDGDEIAQRAIANGNLHLTLEQLLAQQERDLAIILEEEREAAREKAAQAAFEAERKAAEAAAAQEAREATFKQEGQYDRSKDPRNNLDEGMKTETPSYQQLLLQGRKKRTEYKGKKVIRALSYEEVRASENFHRRGIAFVREWHAAQAEWHAENLAKLARAQDADAKKEASRRAREEQVAQARRKREAKRQRIMENKLNRDVAKLEKAIAKNDRAVYNRKGKEYVNPETGEKKTAPLAGFSREKQAKAVAQSEAKKRKQPDTPVQLKQCDTCRSFRKVPINARKGWSCPDFGHRCKEVWQCWTCGYADKREGAPPEGWTCPASGRMCLPMPKKGFPKPLRQ
tara:strand:+ start:28114 stop:31038 length:2925 start_codon:yes stop_codon:yes gene_type:complete